MVGWVNLTYSSKSQAHIPTGFPIEQHPFCLSRRRIFSLVVSATALSTATSCLSVKYISINIYIRLCWLLSICLAVKICLLKKSHERVQTQKQVGTQSQKLVFRTKICTN